MPLFLLCAPMEFLCFPPGAAIFHLAYGITLSLLLMELMFFGFRKIPFTCAHFPGKVNLSFLAVIYIFGFTTYSRTMAAFEQWLTASPRLRRPLLRVAFAALAASDPSPQSPDRRHRALDFEDAGDPVVRTLGLSPE